MRHTGTRTALLLALTVVAGLAPLASAAPTLKGRAVWANPREAGLTEASVVAYVEQLAKAHVNTLIMELKTSGGLFWPSERFAPAVVAEYKEFDLPAVLIRECHKRGIAFHVWFFDFAEGANSYVAQQHPEWLALSPEGKPTSAEVLRGQPYRMAWMCPARRPGYTDQWLIPVIKEFAERYDVDAIHHDYVRYPGDLAPDTYCFCDYCLEEIPKYASYYSTTHPDHPLLAPMDRPHLEAHWERSPKVLPPNWKDYGREMKSRLLLEGSFFPGGNRDLDYFFYEYRAHQIAAFTRAGVRGGAEGEAADGVLGRGVQEPRAERPLHRAGLAALLAVGPVPHADGLPQPLRRGLRDPPRPARREHPAAEGLGPGLPALLARGRGLPALRRGAVAAHPAPRAPPRRGQGRGRRCRRPSTRSRPG